MPPSSLHSDPLDTSPRLRIGYLLSRYPAVSHTFFLKEVLGVRSRGIVVEVASINPPDRRRDQLPEVEAAEADTTYYVKPRKSFAAILELLGIVLTHPAVAFRGLGAALSLGGWDLLARAFALFYLAEALLVGRWIQRRSLQHLHVHFGGAVATVGMLAAQAWQIPWSVTLHGPDEFFDQEAFYLRKKIESASFVVCISDFCRSQVLRVAPDLDQSRLEVVRLGVDCDVLRPRVNDPSASVNEDSAGETVRLVCTGRMVAAKGHRILIEAVAAMAASGVSCTLTLIGDGPERAALEAQCRHSGIAGQVRFLGAMAHGPTLAEVARADVFVLASFAEGLPVALMEAMSLGVPCVSTIIAAIPELIFDNQNGLLVPASNSAALRHALERLVNDKPLRTRLGISARTTVTENYDLSRNLNQLTHMWTRRLTISRQNNLAYAAQTRQDSGR